MTEALPRRLTARDLFTLRWLDTPRISPDGMRVAFLETTLDEASDQMRNHVVLQSVSGGAPVRIDVPDPGGLAWSPDSAWLAVSGRGLWVAPATGGPARRVVEGAASEPAWSPDGRRLAFAALGERDRRVHVVAADGSGLRRLDRPDAHQPRWSPDGRALAFLGEDALWHVGAALEEPSRRVPVPAASVAAFAWSPDSTELACLGRADGDLLDVSQRLWLVSLERGSERELSGPPDAALGSAVRGDDPRGTGHPTLCWSPASGRLYVESVLNGRGPLVWFDAHGATGLLLDDNHACLSPSVSHTGRLAVVISGPDGPGDVWTVGEDAAREERLTDVDAATRPFVAPTEHLQVEYGGVTLDAWLTGPAAADPAPLIVNVHGGPYCAIGWRFTFEVQRLAANGARVLTINPRGSSGCGDDFASANRGDWGGVDAADVMAVVDAVSARADIDESRMAVWGVSYGGFMAQRLLTGSDRFRTAISENGISDFAALWDADPARRPFWTLALGGPPDASDPSPVRAAAQIHTPLLLIHAEEDETCPILQSERMAQALRVAGAHVELVRLPGEGHLINLIGRPSSRLHRAAVVDDWLRRTLLQP